MKYLIKANYFCDEIKLKEGKWLIVEEDTIPKTGLIKKKILPPHGCRKYLYSQACDEDETCYWQEILEIKPFTEEEAIRLNAENISGLEERCQDRK